jgi:KDO2-lipid IV(A) lauroyltransferase
VGRIASTWIPIRRRVVEENLGIAFPEWNEAKRREVVRECYVTLAVNALDLLASRRASRDQIRAGVEEPLDDGGRLAELRRSENGFIIVTAHIGSWEWGGAYLAALGLDLADVAKPLQSPAAERFVSAIRRRLGVKLISTEESPMRIVRHLRGGGVLSLFTDQNVRREGIFVPFFGREASTAPGAGYLAYRLGVPVLPMWGFRRPDGRIQAIVDDVLRADPSKPIAEEIERITRSHVASLERAIRLHPGQYFWFHRRWRTRPPAPVASPPATRASAGAS